MTHHSSLPHSTLNTLLRFAFNQFYTTFAWTYDAVAAAVSFGEWRNWGRAVLTQVPASAKVLELAHGPGHLHLYMREQGYDVVSLDLSAQMGRLLARRLERTGLSYDRHVQANAQTLPFADGQFDCIVCTFPTAFIFAPSTLAEMRRVLKPSGYFVVVPGVRLRKTDVATQFLRFAFRITGQAEPDFLTVERRFAEHDWRLSEIALSSHSFSPSQVAEVIVWRGQPVPVA